MSTPFRSSSAITKLIGNLPSNREVKNLLEEVDNGDEATSRVAVDTLQSLNISKEMLGIMTIAIHLDETDRVLKEVNKMYKHIRSPEFEGCSALKLAVERIQKMFFRGVCICLGIPLLLWIIAALLEHYIRTK